MTDPNGNPGCLRESVERLPIRPKYTKVRARSANEGSGIAGKSLAVPGPACFPTNEDIAVFLADVFRNPESLKKLTRRARRCLFKSRNLSKSDERHGFVDLRILHKRIPHELRLVDLDHLQGNPEGDANDVGIVPSRQWIERVHEPISGPDAGRKLRVDILEYRKRPLRQKGKRAGGGRWNDAAIDRPHRRRAA